MKTSLVFLFTLLFFTGFISSCGTQQKDMVYQCPMKCEGEKIYENPGTCPVCGMDLEKVPRPAKKENQYNRDSVADSAGHSHDTTIHSH